MRKSIFRRLSAILAASLMVIGGASVAFADGLNASVSAPGAAGATMSVGLITNIQSGRTVTTSDSNVTYHMGYGDGNVCARSYQFDFVRPYTSTKSTYTATNPGCGSYVIFSIDAKHWAPGTLEAGSQFCGRYKSDRTGNAYTNRACVSAVSSW